MPYACDKGITKLYETWETVEAIKINITLIRRRLKNTNLKFENMILGSQSNTHVTLCYLSDVVSAKLLNEVKSSYRSRCLAASFISSKSSLGLHCQLIVRSNADLAVWAKYL